MPETNKTIGDYATMLKAFLKQLMSGDFGLAKTYWLYGVAGVFGLLFVSLLLTSVIATIFTPLGTILFLACAVAIFAYGVAAMIGAWRAASKYEGPPHWALLTKLAIGLGALPLALFVLFIVLSIVTFFLQPFIGRGTLPEPPTEIPIYDEGKAPVPAATAIVMSMPSPPLSLKGEGES